MFKTRATALALLCSLAPPACVDLPQLSTSDSPPAPRAEPDDVAVPATKTLRFGSWNVRKLGLERGKQLARLASIIEQKLDLVAIVELMGSDAGGDAFVELLTSLGSGWTGHVTSSARPNLPFDHAERYAVLLRSALVAPCSEQPALRHIDDNDGSGDSDAPDLFLREPAIGCYRLRAELGGLDFALGVYHARWGSGRPEEIASEVRNVDRAFAAMSERMPGERQLFMVGDFNLTAATLAPLTSARDRTRGVGSTLDEAGHISSHLYDHLLALGTDANQALADDAVVVDVRGEANDPARFREQVSDHLPIVARLQLGPDQD